MGTCSGPGVGRNAYDDSESRHQMKRVCGIADRGRCIRSANTVRGRATQPLRTVSSSVDLPPKVPSSLPACIGRLVVV